ncbi:U4/U6 small nuclear ribonucleoprotein prp4 [Dispira parvispora]|uniref:non-specific serine/threonine protein kinase n=1 Tax=Dispira parvispora TaxID=1520584 RepID=A0A9W8ATK9_9FUNG|nr:U4/U6 small nuclear ribonucleoprotein prp4 [Dispira parvispora]
MANHDYNSTHYDTYRRHQDRCDDRSRSHSRNRHHSRRNESHNGGRSSSRSNYLPTRDRSLSPRLDGTHPSRRSSRSRYGLPSGKQVQSKKEEEEWEEGELPLASSGVDVTNRSVPTHGGESKAFLGQVTQTPESHPNTAVPGIPGKKETVNSKPLVTDPNDVMDLDVLGWDEQQKIDEKLILERRRKRQAILQKYRPQGRGTALVELTRGDSMVSTLSQGNTDASPLSANTLTLGVSGQPSPESTKEGVNGRSSPGQGSVASQTLLRAQSMEIPTNRTKLPSTTFDSSVPTAQSPNQEDDEDDMFAQPSNTTSSIMADPAEISKPLTQPPVVLASSTTPTILQDNWDDPEGYYRTILGEKLDHRYHVYNNLGKGVFSTVVKARDLEQGGQEVAIKIIRNNPIMYKAGLKEVDILTQLHGMDPQDQRHCVRLVRHFEYRNHLCLVFESLHMNLREVLKKYGREVGLNLRAVRTYAHQIFQALSLLRKCRILHADIKPDNILVNETKNLLKVCDFGSASTVTANDITPYLVSRFYRAPEVILGLSCDYAVDVWSVGCSLYELYTGKILFPGRSNNEMLKLMMQLKGRFPIRMLKRGQFTTRHFDPTLTTFLHCDIDRLTQKEVVRPLVFTKPHSDLKSRLTSSHSNGGDQGRASHRLVNAFCDFLDRCLVLNPEKRLTPADAFAHPFLSDNSLL